MREYYKSALNITQSTVMHFPSHLYYTSEHLWVYQDALGDWLAGVTDYAQDLLGDIVYIEPPKLSNILINGKPCGIIESVKTGSDLHAPMDGIVTEVNEKLLAVPEEVNERPYDAWIFKFKPNNPKDIAHLHTAKAYAKLINAD